MFTVFAFLCYSCYNSGAWKSPVCIYLANLDGNSPGLVLNLCTVRKSLELYHHEVLYSSKVKLHAYVAVTSRQLNISLSIQARIMIMPDNPFNSPMPVLTVTVPVIDCILPQCDNWCFFCIVGVLVLIHYSPSPSKLILF